MGAGTNGNCLKSNDAGISALMPSPKELTLAANLHKLRMRSVDSIVLANRRWFERLNIEAHHVLELGFRLFSAKSIPETAQAYEEWFRQRLSLAALDAKTASAAPYKLIEVSSSVLARRGELR